ncbi:right-handed parallel beta-helix repeat-containing protein [Anaeromicropila herbilytica]|uniref:Right handed beta helix domain-containing protein n=1 Tax=Anaeromicropila herbilytica TaxID=2785025 RepID=A0A7R7EK42_9FIRM|nr:right-handed parallel beta-helix repeat-containing protein [Anaeromicropila herbilytica]BCN30252.1 hypothetical protein bsdtb5_15470 [Anaeromicropila herbilytica]
MKLDTLTKLNNKKKMWISPKHPLFFESLDFKIKYAAGVFVHAALNKTVNTLNNFELQRLLNIGLGLNGKEMANVINLAQKKEDIVGDIIELLDEPVKKYLFLLDISSVAMRSTELCEEEMESIKNYLELLHIEVETFELLYDFIKCSTNFDSDNCIKVFEKMIDKELSITMSELKYYIPEIAYVTKIDSKIMKKGMNLRLVDNCEIKETIIVPTGTTLYIANAVIHMYGTIIVDGGKLVIRDSKLVNKDQESDTLIVVKNFSEVEIYNTNFDCRYMGSAIDQDNGKLKVIDSKFFHTTKKSAIRFWGSEIHIENSLFHDCLTNKDGAALKIETGNGIIKGCTFENCEAKNGGAIDTRDGIMILNSKFSKCSAKGYGAAIFYHGEVKSNVSHCEYIKCRPEKEELIQYITSNEEKVIDHEYTIIVSTILDQPLRITSLGVLAINNATVYVEKTIICSGVLIIKNSNIIAGNDVGRDIFVITRARGVNISQSEFDGHLRAGIFCATGSRMQVSDCIFRNTSGGRAIFDAFEPEIRGCIFSYCLGGALNACSGKITDSVFVSTRAKNGAAILMYGAKGEIGNCKFVKCISDYSGGAIDATLGNTIRDCEYEDCNQ